jgi:hypothetical protein
MCCFSGKVKAVADTNIFARGSKDGRQFLVYSMKVDAPEELAMILPLPTPKKSKEDAVRFLNLEKYPEFFEEMRAGFPAPRAGGRGKGPPTDHAPDLKVVEVGSFIASFVPAVQDFERVDQRFRLPSETWDKLPQYKDYGFAVFQLKKGAQKVHPMAFEFPRADAGQLFFPTVHIHDGTVRPKAKFDHALFCQKSGEEDLTRWDESPQPAGLFMKKHDRSQKIVDPELHCYRKLLGGLLKNEDVLV